MRIFLIEDGDLLRDVLASFLEMRGHEVITASDPTACPAYDPHGVQCPHERPCTDVLLVDQNMPNMTGLEFIRMQLKRSCKGSVGNKAIMSADLTPEETELAIQLGCKIFPKPLSMLCLTEWLESINRNLPENRKLANFD